MADIYTFKDLISGKFSESECSRLRAGAKNFAVLGFPVKHSLSPIMQNAALGEIAKEDFLYENSKYFALEIEPENLKQTLEILPELNFVGVNLTIPHKEKAFELFDDSDLSAKDARACNTLFCSDGRWTTFNTDGFGLQMSFEKCFEASFQNLHVYIVGAGGAARGVAHHIARLCPRSLNIANRSRERLEALLSDLRGSGFACSEFDASDASVFPVENCAIINASLVGLNASDSPVLNFEKIPQTAIFFDMPYLKACETSSVKAARKFGIRAESGLPMLAYQGAKSLQIWTSKDFKGALMLETLKALDSPMKKS